MFVLPYSELSILNQNNISISNRSMYSLYLFQWNDSIIIVSHIDLVCMLLVAGLYLESNYNTNSLTAEDALNVVWNAS